MMGFASDVDEYNNEIIPEAKDSDPVFVTRDLAMEAALREDSEYGASFHPETCLEHRNVNMRCNSCEELDTFCLSCDLTTAHDCNQSSYINI